jgi:hypothetical protein
MAKRKKPLLRSLAFSAEMIKREVTDVIGQIERLPDDYQPDVTEEGWLEDMRHEAIRLTLAIESLIGEENKSG